MKAPSTTDPMSTPSEARREISSGVAQVRYRKVRAVSFYASGGHARLRIREVPVRDHLAPLMSRGAVGTAKVDLLLRSLAKRDGDQPDAGCVPSQLTWENLHDLVRPRQFYRSDIALKRKWITDKLDQLEAMGLLRRQLRAGRRSKIAVLRDDGSRMPFDDPGGTTDSYVTILGASLKVRGSRPGVLRRSRLTWLP
jgi:hypothetical protein